jgi:hypothetical protein
MESSLSVYGFRFLGQRVENMFANVDYARGKIVIRSIWDLRDQMFGMRLYLRDWRGRVPPHWQMNKQNKVVGGYISELLEKLGCREVGKGHGDMFDKYISSNMYLMQNYCPSILQGKKEVFVKINALKDKTQFEKF